MAHKQLVGYNPTTKQLEEGQTGDHLASAIAVQFDLTLDVTGLVNGRDMVADGTKLDLATMTAATNLDTMRTQLGYVTVTQPVDLDALETRVNALDASVVLMGVWDASIGTFPVSTKAGESWIISVAGTVAGIPFAVDDRIVALVDGASASVYTGQWHKLDYTDAVNTVAGKTGTVVLVEADITDLQSYLLPTSIDSLSKLNALVGETLLVQSTMGDWSPQTAPTYQEGKTWYDSTKKCFSGYTNFADITMNFGEELWAPVVVNNTGVLIPDGTPVYKSGTSGGLAEITPVIANGYRVYGITTHAIADGAQGRVTVHGSLTGPDFSSFGANDILYLSAVTPGLIVNVPPVYPQRVVELGTVLDNSNPGSMMVDIEHHGNENVITKSYNFSSRTAASGTYYLGGFYDFDVADLNLTQASATGTHGVAGSGEAAHAFMVFGAGATDGTTVTLTVTGTSQTDEGVNTPADSEVLYTGTVAGLTLNDYKETTKKWVGQVTYTLTSDGVNFSMDFNYGFAKYEDFNNLDATLRAIEFVGLADAADSGFNLQLIHHNATAFLYSAAAFTDPLSFADLNTDHGGVNDLKAGRNFSWKRTNLSQPLGSSGLGGVVIKVVTSVNNSVAYMNGHMTAITA
jgi:hypothetical protein